MNIDLNQKSDVGHLRLESPTSDIEKIDGLENFELRRVPLRDVARYAGRLIRWASQERTALLVTDRNKPLAVIVPAGGPVGIPSFARHGEEPMNDTPQEEFVEPPSDLPERERALLELLGAEPTPISKLSRATELTIAELAMPLTQLAIKRLVKQTGRGWKRR